MCYLHEEAIIVAHSVDYFDFFIVFWAVSSIIVTAKSIVPRKWNLHCCMCVMKGKCEIRGVRGAGTHDNSAHGLMSIWWMGGRRPRPAVGAAINFIYSYVRMWAVCLCRWIAGRLVMSGTVTFLAFRSRSVFNSCFKTGRATASRRAALC